jgi:hypothetical protein
VGAVRRPKRPMALAMPQGDRIPWTSESLYENAISVSQESKKENCGYCYNRVGTARSIGFCVIWVRISPSSSSVGTGGVNFLPSSKVKLVQKAESAPSGPGRQKKLAAYKTCALDTPAVAVAPFSVRTGGMPPR